MVVAQQPLMVGALWLVVIVLVPTTLFWLALKVPAWVDELLDRRAERLQAMRPHGPPLEKLAADLRRLRAEIVEHKPTSNVRHIGLLKAYDDVLVAVCDRLEIPTGLSGLPIGRDRDVERLRTESAVQEAGVPLRASGRRAPS
jgi:hypothetical protein